MQKDNNIINLLEADYWRAPLDIVAQSRGKFAPNVAIPRILDLLDKHELKATFFTPGWTVDQFTESVEEIVSRGHELAAHGYKVRPYHAGMSPRDRKQNQDAFMKERVDTIVATVAFGMGIDKSNVRYVIHTGLPKSLEHYQQESGRAGRDGLQADCCLIYSGGDYGVWKSILSNEPNSAEIGIAKLNDMYSYATGATCRHNALVSYFGQKLDSPNCTACDICLGDVECVEDALVIAQKIISCIARLRQNFGGEYAAQVLTGSRDQRILKSGHENLSTTQVYTHLSQEHLRKTYEAAHPRA